MSKYPCIILSNYNRRLVQVDPHRYIFEKSETQSNAMNERVSVWVTESIVNLYKDTHFNHVDNRASNYALEWLIEQVKNANIQR